MARRIQTDEEIMARVPAARERSRTESETDPRALRAWYESATARIHVELTNGWLVGFPAEAEMGLRAASPEELSAVQVELDGEGLHWEKLDVDLLVPELMRGLFGARWMSEVGRTLGSKRSEAKAHSSRMNGRKGGRPRKGATG